MTTNITEDHRRAFEALTGGEAGNFCLFSCFLLGRPAAAIAAVTVCPPTEEGGEPNTSFLRCSSRLPKTWS